MSMKPNNKHLAKSSWTPLSNEQANSKLYDERRGLISVWFDKWGDQQRKNVIEDLLKKCKLRQLEFAGDIVKKKRPIYNEDFTKVMPRVIALYIFSFLDPRSLSRCAQVCWYWKYLSELDQLWMFKCVRLGWLLPFQPSPYEVGTWKRHYIENIKVLKCIRPKGTPRSNTVDLFNQLDLDDGDKSSRRPKSSRSGKRPPWKGSDPVPQDTWRNNYLKNDDEKEKVEKIRQKNTYGTTEIADINRSAKPKLNTGKHANNSQKMLRAKSIPNLNGWTGDRPEWARTQSQAAGEMTTRTIATTPGRPNDTAFKSPIKPKSPMLKRTARDPPSEPLFQDRPWQLPAGEDYDSDT